MRFYRWLGTAFEFLFFSNYYMRTEILGNRIIGFWHQDFVVIYCLQGRLFILN